MFRLRPEARADVRVSVDGQVLMVPAGSTAAAAVLLAGSPAIRTTAVSGSPRLPYCMMGVCFDCLAEIDGVANRQACMVSVSEGMEIRLQHGARMVEAAQR